MTTKEQIKAEIEKRIAAHKTKNGFPAGTLCAIRIEAYEELLSFIDSLPEEKPSEDLEKAAEEYENSLDYYECINQWPSVGFIAGAQWQKEQMMKGALNSEIVRIGDFSDLTFNTEEYKKATDAFKDKDVVKVIIIKEDWK